METEIKQLNRKEYKKVLNYELFNNQQLPMFYKIRLKYFTPNTNCVFLARRMWYLYSQGGIRRALSRIIYIKILRRYGCCIYPNAKVGKGFRVAHPVGIVIGKCVIGENFFIYQNATVGARRELEEIRGLSPSIGNNVTICSNSIVIGKITISDNVIVGANSVVLHDLEEEGTYVGSPAKKVR